MSSPPSSSDSLVSALAGRLAAIHARMAEAATAAGRRPDEIRLIAVSKTFSAEHVRAAAAAGQIDFGENRVQEALQKIQLSSDLQIRWHLVGHLQSNKARRAAEAFSTIHSVDSAALLEQIDRAAEAAGTTPALLVQVDLAREPTKHGAVVGDLPAIFAAAAHCRAATVEGLMLLPPLGRDAEASRPYFQELRRVRDQLADRGVPARMLRQLSMGMSRDFEVAIQEGATMVRIGTALFGERHV